MNEPRYKHVTSVKQAIEILGGMKAFLAIPWQSPTGEPAPLNYKQVAHWVTKDKFPANMTYAIETLLNQKGYAPQWDILTQSEIDVSEELFLLEQLAKSHRTKT
jgi:hypothetical protein